MSGLYLVTVPIGNCKDITLRALECLKEFKNIFCEDTRKTKELLKRLDIDYSDKIIQSFHDQSSISVLERITSLSLSEDVAYVSDAGSPIISDPAFPLVKECIKRNIKIHSMSGISSIHVALELSGLPCNPYYFHGFIGRSPKDISKLKDKINANIGTHIFFEGVSRVQKTLKELSEFFVESDFVVARELTKSFESITRFKGREFDDYDKHIVYKGEFVILVHNAGLNDHKDEIKNEVLALIEDGIHAKSLSKFLARISGLNAKDLYNRLNK